jgi:hypothetical protein
MLLPFWQGAYPQRSDVPMSAFHPKQTSDEATKALNLYLVTFCD